MRLKKPGGRQEKIRMILAFSLLIFTSGCGTLLNPKYASNNQIRLAVYRYERDTRGLTDDLIIHFNRTEPKVKFKGQFQDGRGRTVWLFDLAAKEYFELLPPERTYMYLQSVEYSSNYSGATVKVYRGKHTSYNGRELSLRQNGDGIWQVDGDRELPSGS